MLKEDDSEGALVSLIFFVVVTSIAVWAFVDAQCWKVLKLGL